MRYCAARRMLSDVRTKQITLFAFHRPDRLSVLDSSGKTPSSLMEGTITSHGDYDQCLDIHSRGFEVEVRGKYCAVDVFTLHSAKRTRHDKKFALGMKSFFVGYPFSIGMCIPNACRDEELRQLLSNCEYHMP